MVPGRERVFLVGFMGSGKSLVSRSLADASGWRAVDTDERIVEREGRSIERIFADSGEGRFREAELDELHRIAGEPRVVVATGGGMFARRACRKAIRASGISVWLDAPFRLIRERVGSGHGRPLWSADDPVELRGLFERRRACYALADLRVDVSRTAPELVAERILDLASGVFR